MIFLPPFNAADFSDSSTIDNEYDGIAPIVTDADGNILPLRAYHSVGNRAGYNFLNPVAGEIVRFSDLVAELAEVYEPVATEQGKHLNCRVTPNVELRGNRELLAQMISNLLENAIVHTPAGTSISIELGASEDGRKLVIQDDGPGISTTENERIFERFYRLEESGSKPGNGFGLSLVRSICSLHGFSVRLRPEPNGAAFEVAF